MKSPETSFNPEQKEKEPIPYKHLDDIIDSIWVGNIANEFKQKVRNNDIKTQERLLEIEKGKERIKANKDNKNEIEYVNEQKFEIKCLIRELEGEPPEGTTAEEKKEFRKYHPTTMTDQDVEAAKERMKGINVS